MEFISTTDFSSYHRVILSDGKIFDVKSNIMELGGEIILDAKKQILSQLINEEGDEELNSTTIFAKKIETKPSIDRRVRY